MRVAVARADGDERAAARSLVRLLADLGDVRIAHRASGQPYLPDHPGVAISLSHDGGFVAAACAGAPVGVDVQVPVPVTARLLRRCGVPELALLPADRRDLEFAWVWTAQEACVKATGEGLAGAPWSIPVRCGQTSGRWRGVRWRRLRSVVPACVAYLEAS